MESNGTNIPGEEEVENPIETNEQQEIVVIEDEVTALGNLGDQNDNKDDKNNNKNDMTNVVNTVVIEDEETPLASNVRCKTHWLILLLVGIYTIAQIICIFSKNQRIKELEGKIENIDM